MKHIEKDWYTCDRCGDKIDKVPSNEMWKKLYNRIICKPSELEILTAERYGYITDTNLISPKIVSVEIRESYRENTKTIHLCGKCRKEFERFLRNER